jgi:shikimate kinase
VTSRHLVLVGLMGVGKTTVGRLCATRLGRAFVDTDGLVVAAAGIPFADLWADEGESGFRARERTAVRDAAASPDALVIACGGGAVLDADNRTALRETGFVVWLDAPAEALAARLGPDDSRPLLAGGDRTATLTRLADVRAAAYDAAADVRIETQGRAAADVADAVLEAYAP